MVLGRLEGLFKALSNLQRLNISRSTAGFGGPDGSGRWHRLLQLVPAYLPKLADLSFVELVDEGALPTLTRMQQLTRLRVEVWGEDGMVPLGPLFRMRGLAALAVRVDGPRQFSDYEEGAPTLADLKRATHLRALSLHVFQEWGDPLPWHPLCSALTNLTALTHLTANCGFSSAPSSALRLLALPALVSLRICVCQDALEDRIWPILYRAAPLLQHLDLSFEVESENHFFGLLSSFPGLTSLTRLKIGWWGRPGAEENWPSAAFVTCHSGLRYLNAYNAFHAAHIDRDLPILTAFAQRQGLAIQFDCLGEREKMGPYELLHEWREHVRLSPEHSGSYSVQLEPLLPPKCPSSSEYKFQEWPLLY